MYLGNETWRDLEHYFEELSIALVPVGATEQHGPHLPLATDALIAQAFAREAADRAGLACTPTIDIGVSSHHRQFHGTMWADPRAFREYVESITRNLTAHGIDRVVYVNAHGGNVAPLREVGRRLREDRALYAIEWMWNDSIPDLVEDSFENTGPHGGPKETALIQYLAEDLIHEDRLAQARDGGVVDITTNDTIVNGARTYYDAIDNTENGVTGDQTDATAEKGAQLFDAAADQLVQLCDWLAAQPFEDLMPKEHV